MKIMLFVSSALLALALLAAPARGITPAGSRFVLLRPDVLGQQVVLQDSGRVLTAWSGEPGRLDTLQAAAPVLLFTHASGAQSTVVPLALLPARAQRLSAAIQLLVQARGGRQAEVYVRAARVELDHFRAGSDPAAAPRVAAAGERLEDGSDADAERQAEAALPLLRAALAETLRTQPRETPGATVSTTLLDFGDVAVGETVSFPVTVTNTLSAALKLAVDTSGLRPPFSARGGALGVAKQGIANLNVQFTPIFVGSFTGQVVLKGDALPGGQVTVQVKGNAKPVNIEVPTLVQFGRVKIGSSSTSQVTVKNRSGVKATLNVDTAGVKRPFMGQAGGTISGVYQDGETQSINVTFAPTQPGAYSADVVVEGGHPASRTRKIVTLAGMGVGDVEASANEIDFGEVKVGSTGTRPLTLTNNTDQAVTLKVTAPARSVFGSANPIPATLNARQSLTVDLTFTPDKAGEAAQTWTIKSTGPGGKQHQTLALTGTGVEPASVGLSVTPSSLDFGTVARNTPVQKEFTVTNTSTDVAAVSVDSGSLDSTYTVVNGGQFNLAAGESRTVFVFFSANRACVHRGSIRISSPSGSAKVDVKAASR